VLRGAKVELIIELDEQFWGQGHLADDPPPAALESRDASNAAVDVDRCRREREHFRNARAASSEHLAKQALGRWKPFC
jgi:hypothetical protein